MSRAARSREALTAVYCLCLVCLGPRPASSITVSTPAEIHASKGDTVFLSCTFSSSNTPTSKMMVDWSYRPQTGAPLLTFFHFSSRAFPPPPGQFWGRVSWQGTPARGDVSISLANATLQDNGTFTCSVRNPPDVHGSPTSHTVLTVVPRAPSVRFSDVAVMLALVGLPSAAVALFLAGRMFCPSRTSKTSGTHPSAIEVTEGEEYGPPVEKTRRNCCCCDVYLMDSEDEDEYYDMKKRPLDEDYAESQF